MNRIFLLSVIAGANFLAATATAQTIGAINSDIGRVIVSAKTGMTLYTFRKDTKNTSNCYNDCAAAWPPFAAAASAKADGPLGIIDRADGTRQWTLQGKPLYFWAGDSARGDVTGNGVGGVWDAVRN
jgi:predicted lipoprotein with Yx(FWY)xxD motif